MLGAFTPVLKRQILEACKEVGKVAVINSLPTVEAHIEEDEDPEIAQDLYDAEHNNDDIDVEETIDNAEEE
jgi:hypothetical protein